MNKMLVTAPEIYNHRLKNVLIKNDFQTIQFPVITTEIFFNSNFKSIFEKINSIDYVILPSRNAIKTWFFHWKYAKLPYNKLKDIRFVTIGKDKEYLMDFGFKSAIIPSESGTQGIVKELSLLENLSRVVVVAPKVKSIREPSIIPDLISNLKKFTEVIRMDGYITRPIENFDMQRFDAIVNDKNVYIALTSGGEAEALNFLIGKHKFKNLKFVCFGPYTASTLKKLGVKPIFTGTRYSAFDDFASQLKNFLNH